MIRQTIFRETFAVYIETTAMGFRSEEERFSSTLKSTKKTSRNLYQDASCVSNSVADTSG